MLHLKNPQQTGGVNISSGTMCSSKTHRNYLISIEGSFRYAILAILQRDKKYFEILKGLS